jgi:ribosomal-protein-alanine N-acetyltransferase
MRHDRWRNGYGAEAAVLMLDFAFETLNLHRVQAACGPQNTASQRALEKLGFQYEARIRDHVFTNGAWRDSLLYAVLADEWRMHRVKVQVYSS